MNVCSHVSRLRKPVARMAKMGVLALWSAVWLGCAHDAGQRTNRPTEAGWIERGVTGPAVRGDPEQLSALAQGTPQQRVVRIDRLLDLLDAARFAANEDARESLWLALGGHAQGVGHEATRDAASRVLQEALDVEDAVKDADAKHFLGDAIMLLSTDLELPDRADDLSIRTLAYRTIAEHGHPRVADNARWRLYDHVYGCLAGAIAVGPEQRMEVAVHALYAGRESVGDYLRDAAPHVRPPWPSPSALVKLLHHQRAVLAREQRWHSVLEHRKESDRELEDTVRTALPAERSSKWPLVSVAAGTGRPESLAPVVLIEDGSITVDAGRPQARKLALAGNAKRVADAMQTALTLDGRGTVLLVSEPMMPSPTLHSLLEAIRRSKVARLELALREPRVPDGSGDVIVALPVEIALASDVGPGARAIADARVHVHLGGRGPRFAIDGRWLTKNPQSPSELQQILDDIDRAYPRERVIALTLGPDVLYQQLLELVEAVSGGPARHYQAVGWRADAAPPKGEPHERNDRSLGTRVALFVDEPVTRLEQPFPLKDKDQRRLEELTRNLHLCLPELEATDVPAVRVAMVFEGGRLSSIIPARLKKGRFAALSECLEQESLGFRLREHRDRIAITAVLGKKPTPKR